MSKSAIKFGTGKMNLIPAPINPDWIIEGSTVARNKLVPSTVVRSLPQSGIGHGRSCTEHARRKCVMHRDVARRRRQRMSSVDAGRASIDAVRHKALISQLKTLCSVIPRCIGRYAKS